MTGSPYIDATISDNRHELIGKMQAEYSRTGGDSGDFAQQMARDGDSADSGDYRRQRAKHRQLRSGLAVEAASGKSGNSSGGRSRRHLNRSLTSRRATGLTRRRSVSILLFPGR